MSGVQLALAEPYFDHALDGVIQRSVTKTVGLHAELHAANRGVDARKSRGSRKRGQRQLRKISSRIHKVECTSVGAHNAHCQAASVYKYLVVDLKQSQVKLFSIGVYRRQSAALVLNVFPQATSRDSGELRRLSGGCTRPVVRGRSGWSSRTRRSGPGAGWPRDGIAPPPTTDRARCKGSRCSARGSLGPA